MPTRPHSIVLMMADVKPFGGAETYLYLLAVHLDRSTFAPRVIVPREGPMVERLRQAGVPVDVLPLCRPRDVTRLPRFLKLLRDHHVRLVNAHGVRAGFFGALARARLPIKVAVTEHNLQDWRRHAIPRLIDRFIARHNDVRITVSRSIADDMIAAGVCRPERTKVVYLGIETERYRVDAARRAAARARFGIGPDTLAVVGAGRLAPMKGFIDLVEAAPAIVARVPGARIIIAGDGEERGRLQRRIDALAVGKAVTLPGFVGDMPELLAAADVFVLPSVELPGAPREGLPVVIMEALASNCPVVTTRVSGNPEIIEDGVNGRLVPPGDPPALAAAVAGILEDPDRARLGEAGRRIVDERFSIERSVARHSELFLRLIESSGR